MSWPDAKLQEALIRVTGESITYIGRAANPVTVPLVYWMEDDGQAQDGIKAIAEVRISDLANAAQGDQIMRNLTIYKVAKLPENNGHGCWRLHLRTVSSTAA